MTWLAARATVPRATAESVMDMPSQTRAMSATIIGAAKETIFLNSLFVGMASRTFVPPSVRSLRDHIASSAAALVYSASVVAHAAPAAPRPGTSSMSAIRLTTAAIGTARSGVRESLVAMKADCKVMVRSAAG